MQQLILIDALDESSVVDGRSELVDLLGTQLGCLPALIGVIVTSRPEAKSITSTS